MFYQKQSIGRLGEKIAEKYLKKKGYKILERNYCLRGGEIDLIAQKDGRLIFVEIKTRTSDKFGMPEESIGYFKQKSLSRAIRNYLFKKNIKDQDYQFDVISVILNKEEKNNMIKHFENANLDAMADFL